MRIRKPGRTAGMVVTALLVLASALGLAACGGGGGINGGDTESESVKLEGKPSGSMTISNWPLYIDKGTVPNFEKETGVKVKYIEDVNSNEEFFAKLQPLLAQGESGGRSLFVVTDWMVNKMHELGYLQNFDKSAMPNFEKNLVANLQHPDYDPNREFSAPWQSGMTGLIVNKELAPDVHSICDLFDPKYKGKVDMLSELRDTVPMTLKCMGVDPDHATTSQWLAAVAKVKAAADSGQIRRFTGNDYIRDLSSGDVDFVLGWSGDAIQMQKDNPNIKFVMPKEGCMLWSTSMEIPTGAPNVAAAEAWMNFVYDPKVQADIAEYVNYVTPVKGVKPILAKRDPKLAKSKLIFPTKAYTKNCTFEPVLDGEQGREVTKAFNAVVNG